MPRDGTENSSRYKRDWPRYNERLVRRGELYLNTDWVDSSDDELCRMNEGKRGHPYDFPESMMRFMAAVRQILRMQYRQIEGSSGACPRWWRRWRRQTTRGSGGG